MTGFSVRWALKACCLTWEQAEQTPPGQYCLGRAIWLSAGRTLFYKELNVLQSSLIDQQSTDCHGNVGAKPTCRSALGCLNATSPVAGGRVGRVRDWLEQRCFPGRKREHPACRVHRILLGARLSRPVHPPHDAPGLAPEGGWKEQQTMFSRQSGRKLPCHL